MNCRRTNLLALILLLAATVAARADEVDDYVKAEMQRQNIPGVSVAVLREGRIIKVAGYGLASVEPGVAAGPETVYKIGSVSKQFIAAGIMLLVQEGRIRLDDSISRYLEGTPDTWKGITVRHLLTHTSGIVREAPGFNPFTVQSDADVIKSAYPLPLRFAPGEKWEYCNVGYFALAEIIRAVAGRPWSDYLNERLFTPLAMNATRPTNTTEPLANRASGYVSSAGQWQVAPDYAALRPSGAFLSSVVDLAQWDAALYTDRILTQSVRDQMWAPAGLNNGTAHPYGFGWELDTVGGHRVVRHGGTLPGFRAELARFVDDRLTIVVLTNSSNAEPRTIALGVAALHIPRLLPERIAVRVAPEILDAYVGEYRPNRSSTILTLTREGEKLLMQQGSSSEKQELIPQSESTFFTWNDLRAFFSFTRDEKGEITDLVMQVEGREIGRAKRLR